MESPYIRPSLASLPSTSANSWQQPAADYGEAMSRLYVIPVTRDMQV